MLFCVHRIRKCRPLQALFITVWLEVRVLPAPPCSPTLTEISRGLTNTPRFCGGAGPACSLCREEGPLQRQFGAFCLWRPKTVSPERGKERSETRFACDRDRFAVKSRSRRGSGRRAPVHPILAHRHPAAPGKRPSRRPGERARALRIVP